MKQQVCNISKERLEDIYNIICAFTYRNNYLQEQFSNERGNGATLEDFVNTAYIQYIDKYYSNYDETKGALSTHIHKCLTLNISNLILQAKYNVGFNTARLLSRKDSRGQKARNIYVYPEAIDCCNSTIISDINNQNDKRNSDDAIKTSDLAQEESNIEKWFKQECDAYTIEEFYSSILLGFLQNFQKSNREKVKNVVLTYILNKKNGVTYRSLGKEFGISHERVRQYLNRFYLYLDRYKKQKQE